MNSWQPVLIQHASSMRRKPWTPQLRQIMFLFVAVSAAAAAPAIAGSYSRLQVLLPGEVPAPGTATGKTGTPIDQTAGTSFGVRVRACDSEWNTVTTVTNTISISSTDASATLPGEPLVLSSGELVPSVTLNAGGEFTFTAHDDTDGSIADATSASVTSWILAGFEFNRFESMTIEGEDRIRIDFERPSLSVDLDPLAVGGLEWIEPAAVADRVPVDLLRPYLDATAVHRTAFTPRPWLMRLPEGPVARFRPDVSGVDRWSFIIADSRGQTVASFHGEGKPPKEIAWDGLTVGGEPATPGLTYSHALEAFDEAGNKRSFVGEGFELPPYVVTKGDGLAVLIPGSDVASLVSARGDGMTPTLVLEAASLINDADMSGAAVTIRAIARSFDQANTLSRAVAERMATLLVGDPLRIKPVADVRPDGPAAGAVSITVEG